LVSPAQVCWCEGIGNSCFCVQGNEGKRNGSFDFVDFGGSLSGDEMRNVKAVLTVVEMEMKRSYSSGGKIHFIQSNLAIKFKRKQRNDMWHLT